MEILINCHVLVHIRLHIDLGLKFLMEGKFSVHKKEERNWSVVFGL